MGAVMVIVKVCIKCHRLVLADTLVCLDCGGTLFMPAELDVTGEDNGE